MNGLRGAVFILAIAGFIVSGCQSAASSASRESIGEHQRFALQDTEGKTVRLDDVLKSNKAVLLNFWATWCPPCREEIPGLIDLKKKYGSKGFEVVGVDVGESAVKAKKFAEKTGINYPIVLDEDTNLSQAYRVVGIPTSFLIASDGKILGVYHEYGEELVTAVEEAVS